MERPVPTKDAELRKKHNAKYYGANKDAQIVRVRLHKRKVRAENRIKIDAIKDVPCLDCKQKFPSFVMDFDHVRGEKEFTISARLELPWERLQAEIDKCDVVCANCHRIRTYAPVR